MSCQKALLLDFDGVILRKHPAHNAIALRCQKYANKHLKFRNPIKLREINASLYKTYGHTVLGLRALGYDVCIREFNDQVYQSFPYDYAFRDLQETNHHEIKAVKDILNQAKKRGIKTYLFSNAPDIWCFSILNYMGLNIDRWFDGSLSSITEKHLKPETECFTLARSKLSSVEQFIFIDDSFINFKNVLEDPQWKLLLLSPEIQIDPIMVTPSLCISNELSDILPVLKR